MRMPWSRAFLAASSAATCAANGVDLRDPLEPCAPADDQAMALPCASVMVIIVLLNVELTCATPDEMFLRSRRRMRAASFAMTAPSVDLYTAVIPAATPAGRQVRTPARRRRTQPALFLLAGNRLGRTLAGAGVGVGALTATRQRPAMAEAAIAAKIHQPLDVHRHFAAQVALDLIVAVDRLADRQKLGIGQVGDAPIQGN